MTIASLSRSTGILLRYANRHGIITGQTGTGKTVSLMRLAESFSSQGVPVFAADIKGDIAALSRSCPTALLDVFGQTGKPLKVTVSAMGADLMARALELSDTQAGCLEIAFSYSSDKRTPMRTLDDLRAVLACLEKDSDVARRYGRVSSASVGVIMRAILRLEMQGGNQFFGNPQFDVADLLVIEFETADAGLIESDGRTKAPLLVVRNAGLVSILDATRLINSPRVYAAFLLWLLTELWDRLPEIGDTDKPRLVMFFDEAHLLFTDCPDSLLQRIEQTVRLIRSKGVGVYFVSQRPDDIPALIRSQLAHTLEHDRALPVGTTRFATMTPGGRPLAPVTVKVDLPSCPLGALSPSEAVRFAPMPEPVASPARRTEPLISAVTVAAILLCAVAIVLWQFDGLAKLAAIGLGAVAGVMTAKPG